MDWRKRNGIELAEEVDCGRIVEGRWISQWCREVEMPLLKMFHLSSERRLR